MARTRNQIHSALLHRLKHILYTSSSISLTFKEYDHTCSNNVNMILLSICIKHMKPSTPHHTRTVRQVVTHYNYQQKAIMSKFFEYPYFMNSHT
jgi:hypothetical protein